MDFGKKLKDLISEKNINVSELAQMTGINRNTLYSYIRRGTQKIDPVILQKLATALNVDVYYFLGTNEPNKSMRKEPAAHDEPQRDEFIQLFSRLSSEQRQIVLGVMRGFLGSPSQSDAPQE